MMNDEVSKRELSIDELEAIAVGWPHWLDNAVYGFMRHHPLAAAIIGATGAVGVGVEFALLPLL